MGLLGFEKSFQEGKQQVVLACLANFETNDRWPPALVWKPPSAEIVKGRLTWHVTKLLQTACRAYTTEYVQYFSVNLAALRPAVL